MAIQRQFYKAKYYKKGKRRIKKYGFADSIRRAEDCDKQCEDKKYYILCPYHSTSPKSYKIIHQMFLFYCSKVVENVQ